jgi:hypothetical protein
MAIISSRIRLMARLSNFGVTFDSGDTHESPAGIVALFARLHNILPDIRAWYGLQYDIKGLANQIQV